MMLFTWWRTVLSLMLRVPAIRSLVSVLPLGMIAASAPLERHLSSRRGLPLHPRRHASHPLGHPSCRRRIRATHGAAQQISEQDVDASSAGPDGTLWLLVVLAVAKLTTLISHFVGSVLSPKFLQKEGIIPQNSELKILREYGAGVI